MGTKACEKAPSAKVRRSRLGSLKATTKASAATPAPKIRAMMVSRTKPRMRDSMVAELTLASDLSRFIGRDCLPLRHFPELAGECRAGSPRKHLSGPRHAFPARKLPGERA